MDSDISFSKILLPYTKPKKIQVFNRKGELYMAKVLMNTDGKKDEVQNTPYLLISKQCFDHASTPLFLQNLYQQFQFKHNSIMPLIRLSITPSNSFEAYYHYPANGKLSDYIGFAHENVLSESKTLSPTQKSIIAYGLAHALNHIHQQNYVFSEVNANNIFLDENFYPYLTNFYSLKKINDTNVPKSKRLSSKHKLIDVFAYSLVYAALIEPIDFDPPIKSAKEFHEKLSQKKRPVCRNATEKQKKILSKLWEWFPQEEFSFDRIIQFFEKGDLLFDKTDMKEFMKYRNYLDKSQTNESTSSNEFSALTTREIVFTKTTTQEEEELQRYKEGNEEETTNESTNDQTIQEEEEELQRYKEGNEEEMMNENTNDQTTQEEEELQRYKEGNEEETTNENTNDQTRQEEEEEELQRYKEGNEEETMNEKITSNEEEEGFKENEEEDNLNSDDANFNNAEKIKDTDGWQPYDNSTVSDDGVNINQPTEKDNDDLDIEPKDEEEPEIPIEKKENEEEPEISCENKDNEEEPEISSEKKENVDQQNLVDDSDQKEKSTKKTKDQHQSSHRRLDDKGFKEDGDYSSNSSEAFEEDVDEDEDIVPVPSFDDTSDISSLDAGGEVVYVDN